VRYVGQEPALPGHRRIQPFGHGVEGRGEFPHLVVAPLLAQAPVELAAAETSGGGGNASDRAEKPAQQQVAGQHPGHQRHGGLTGCQCKHARAVLGEEAQIRSDHHRRHRFAADADRHCQEGNRGFGQVNVGELRRHRRRAQGLDLRTLQQRLGAGASVQPAASNGDRDGLAVRQDSRS